MCLENVTVFFSPCSNRCHKSRSKPTIVIATVFITTVAIETIAIVTVAITIVTSATVNLTAVTIATVLRSFKVLLGGVMIDSSCLTVAILQKYGGSMVEVEQGVE